MVSRKRMHIHVEEPPHPGNAVDPGPTAVPFVCTLKEYQKRALHSQGSSAEDP